MKLQQREDSEKSTVNNSVSGSRYEDDGGNGQPPTNGACGKKKNGLFWKKR